MHIFAGAGGGILADLLLGHQPVCAVEINEYCQQVLSARQKDGCLPWFPIFADVTQFDGNPWRGRVDVVAGGFPCQDISSAGKGAGIDGERSGLWAEMARVICEVRPRFVFVENSPMLTSRGLGRVLGDLASMGFDARWGVLGADDAGAPHIRKRIWILANAMQGRPHPLGKGSEESPNKGQPDNPPGCGEALAHANRRDGHRGGCSVQMGWKRGQGQAPHHGHPGRIEWIPEPPVGRLAHGVAHRVDQLRALGNGQVPSVAAMAWQILSARLAGEVAA
jgi:DNA (cytosine-5)-methyltransferase 1